MAMAHRSNQELLRKFFAKAETGTSGRNRARNRLKLGLLLAVNFNNKMGTANSG
jgi:hypothetical protein